MKFSVTNTEDVVVFEMKGDLWGAADTYELIDEAKAQLGKGERKFLVDLKKTKRSNSTGIGVLIHMMVSVKNAKGELKLCEVTGKARTAMVVTGVLQVFDIYDTREEALRAFTVSATP